MDSIIQIAEDLEDKTPQLIHYIGNYHLLKEYWCDVTDMIERINNEVDYILNN